MNFKEAVQNTQLERRTDNGMKTFHSSLSKCVDLFFQIGASRGKNIIPQFEQAYQEDRLTALRVLFWSRDIRGGAGEREIFRQVIRHLETAHPEEVNQIINLASWYGRWDDLLALQSPLARKAAFDKIKSALLVDRDGLCAKWMPRKGADAVALRLHMGMTPKTYRKTLVNLTKVVETAMCAKDWTNINYNHIPSVAAARYQAAFGRHDPNGYAAYKAKLITGEAKINAAAVYPYDVIKSVRHLGGDKAVALAQWEALPNFIGDSLVLPMVDVSGSMCSAVAGNKNLTCMDVSLSLGLYLADKNVGPFKDMFLTFSGQSKIEVLKGNLIEKLDQLSAAEWGMNTNLHTAFDAILNVAKKNLVSADEMPKYVLILSDMEFDACTQHDDSAMAMIERKYAAAGYTVPNVIFWNLNARENNVPVRYNQTGTALISGFSPAIVASVLAADAIDPTSIMNQTVNSERYAVIN